MLPHSPASSSSPLASPASSPRAAARAPTAAAAAAECDSSSGRSSAGMCCTVRKDERSGRRRASCRCNFMAVFVSMAVAQVLIACALIWYFGYRSTNLTVNKLVAQLRTSVLRDTLYEVNEKIAQPIKAAHTLRYMTENRFAAFGSLEQISNIDGWLADMSHVLANYPTTTRVTLANSKGLVAGLNRGLHTSLDSVVPVVIELSEPGANTSYVAGMEIPYLQYIAHPIRTFNYSQGSTPTPDGAILPSDSAAAIQQYLGPSPAATVPGYVSTSRPPWQAGLDLATKPGNPQSGWSNAFFSLPSPLSPGFFSLAAISIVRTPSGGLDWLAWASFSTRDFHLILSSLDLGPNGSAYIIRPRGRCAASSKLELTELVERQGTDIDMRTSDDEWLPTIFAQMLEWNLVTNRVDITARNASLVVPYRSTQYQAQLRKRGEQYTLQAAMLAPEQSGLPYTLVLLSKNSDFDGDVTQNAITSAWLSGIVVVLAVLLSVLVARCVTTPLREVVAYMDKAVAVIEMARSEQQRVALAQLCESWSEDTNSHYLPVSESASRRPIPLLLKPRSELALPSARGFTDRLACCLHAGRSVLEVQLMQRAFSSVLYSLASYDELEAINQAKRQFIRYIFHEVRVPFNAIVLGIEQMQMEVKTQQQLQQSNAEWIGSAPPAVLPLIHEQRLQQTSSLDSCVDTLAILREQSDVVSHILNDVLSMQKIEDGALKLEIDAFNLERMMRGALFAFRSAAVEKRLKIELNMDSLDAVVNNFIGLVPHLRRDPVMEAARLRATRERDREASKELKRNDSKGNRSKASSKNHPSQTTRAASQLALSLPDPLFEDSAERPHGPSDPIELGTIVSVPLGPSIAPAAAHDEDGEEAHASTKDTVYHAMIMGDTYRLRQCVANFLSNAVKFSPAEGLVQMTLEYSDFQPARESGTSTPSDSTATTGPQTPVAVASKRLGSAASVPHSPVAAASQQGYAVVDVKEDGDGGVSSPLVPAPSVLHLPPPSLHQAPHDSPSPADRTLGSVLVKVSCRDQGVGITKENQKEMFQLYHQVDANKTQKGGGSGLGLSIAKSIIELHGGRIGVVSEGTLHRGAMFFFEMRAEVVLVERGPVSGGPTRTSSSRERTTTAGTTHTVHSHGSADPSGIYSKKNEPLTNDTLHHVNHLAAFGAADRGDGGVDGKDFFGLASLPKPQPVETSLALTESSHSRVAFHFDDNEDPMTISLPEVQRWGGRDVSIAASATVTMPLAMRRPSVSPPVPSYYASPSATPASFSRTLAPVVQVGTSASSTWSLMGAGAVGSNDGSTAASSASAPQKLSSSHAPAQNLSLTLASSSASPPVTSPTENGRDGAIELSSLPSTPVAASTSISAPSGPRAKRGISGSLKPGMRVLVVEDSVPNRKLLMSLLAHMGCDPTGAEDGRECVDLFPLSSSDAPAAGMKQFDVIIMDGSMPRMNGVEATQMLRSRGFAIPILALTGNALAEDQAAFLSAGANQVLTKPINRPLLQKTLSQFQKAPHYQQPQ